MLHALTVLTTRESLMEDARLKELVRVAASDSDTLTSLRDDPETLAEKFELELSDLEALRSADLLLELDRDPLGRSAITLTGGVTKSVTKSYRESQPLNAKNLGRFTKKDLIRTLKLALVDKRFAAKLRADLGL